MQSDYIQRLKLTVSLSSEQSKFPPILESQNYTLYKKLVNENTVISQSPRYHQLVPIGKHLVLGMEIPNHPSCSTEICTKPFRKTIPPVLQRDRPPLRSISKYQKNFVWKDCPCK